MSLYSPSPRDVTIYSQLLVQDFLQNRGKAFEPAAKAYNECKLKYYQQQQEEQQNANPGQNVEGTSSNDTSPKPADVWYACSQRIGLSALLGANAQKGAAAGGSGRNGQQAQQQQQQQHGYCSVLEVILQEMMRVSLLKSTSSSMKDSLIMLPCAGLPRRYLQQLPDTHYPPPVCAEGGQLESTLSSDKGSDNYVAGGVKGSNSSNFGSKADNVQGSGRSNSGDVHQSLVSSSSSGMTGNGRASALGSISRSGTGKLPFEGELSSPADGNSMFGPPPRGSGSIPMQQQPLLNITVMSDAAAEGGSGGGAASDSLNMRKAAEKSKGSGTSSVDQSSRTKSPSSFEERGGAGGGGGGGKMMRSPADNSYGNHAGLQPNISGGGRGAGARGDKYVEDGLDMLQLPPPRFVYNREMAVARAKRNDVSQENWIPAELRMKMFKRGLKAVATSLADAESKDRLAAKEALRESRSDLLINKSLESCGLKRQKYCALCEQSFSEVNLVLSVPYKAIVDLRLFWHNKFGRAANGAVGGGSVVIGKAGGGINNKGATTRHNMLKPPQCYNLQPVCVFCSQLFQDPLQYRPTYTMQTTERQRMVQQAATAKEKEYWDPLTMVKKDKDREMEEWAKEAEAVVGNPLSE